MPDYKRFIAYFYEYIDGKRQRNAGFVKVERRDGSWRISLQLKGQRWPEEPLTIWGYTTENGQYQLAALAKGYPRKDGLLQKFQLAETWISESGKHFEDLAGMWISCDEKRCFLSHWADGEVEVEKLKQAGNEKGREIAEDRVMEDVKEGEEAKSVTGHLYQEECQEIKNQVSQQLSHAELSGGVEQTFTNQPEDLAWENAPLLRREPQECLEDMGRVLCRSEVSEQQREMDAQSERALAREQDAELPEELEMQNDEPRMVEQTVENEAQGVTEQSSEKDEQQMIQQSSENDERQMAEQSAGTHEQKIMETWAENEAGKMEDRKSHAWEMLRNRHPVVRMFPEEYECIGICPGDILWLRQQGWPVGRNSFLMQGFSRYRHLLLGRKADGSYLLGVPGIEHAQMQNMARMFGFGIFKRTEEKDGFGYWCREIK